MYTRTILVLAGLLAIALTPASAAVIVNFDEFTSPPVTCCYGNPVMGPLNYADVRVHDGLGNGHG